MNTDTTFFNMAAERVIAAAEAAQAAGKPLMSALIELARTEDSSLSPPVKSAPPRATPPPAKQSHLALMARMAPGEKTAYFRAHEAAIRLEAFA